MMRLVRSFALVAVVPVVTLGTVFFTKPVLATDIEQVISPGGIEAWLVADDSLPIISMRFSFDAGSSFDPEDRQGVASMLSVMLTKGAGDLDETAFRKRLGSRSISIGFESFNDNFYGELSTLSPRKDEAFELLEMALKAPRFDDEPLERTKDQLTASLKQSQAQGRWVSQRFLGRMTYGDHPYARDGIGTLDSIAAIEAADLRAFMANRLTRDSLLISVVGDITAEQLGEALDDIFGHLPAEAVGEPVAVGDVPDQPRVVVVEMEQPQTSVSISQQGVARRDPDWFAASIANYILGGGSFQSRLMIETRVKRGLTYGVYSGLRPGEAFNVLFAGGSTNHEDAGEFLKILKDEWRKMAAEGPTDEEVEQAKGYLIGSFALSMTNTSDIADVLLAIQEHELGIDYINRRSDEIAAVTTEDVKRVSRELLTPDALRVVAVGKPEGIDADRVVPLGADLLEALQEEPVPGS